MDFLHKDTLIMPYIAMDTEGVSNPKKKEVWVRELGYITETMHKKFVFKTKQDFSNSVNEITSDFKNKLIIAHQAKGDIRLLNHDIIATADRKKKIRNNYFCTSVFLNILLDLKNGDYPSLQKALDIMEISYDKSRFHDSLYDALMTLEIFKKITPNMVQKYNENYIKRVKENERIQEEKFNKKHPFEREFPKSHVFENNKVIFSNGLEIDIPEYDPNFCSVSVSNKKMAVSILKRGIKQLHNPDDYALIMFYQGMLHKKYYIDGKCTETLSYNNIKL